MKYTSKQIKIFDSLSIAVVQYRSSVFFYKWDVLYYNGKNCIVLVTLYMYCSDVIVFVAMGL